MASGRVEDIAVRFRVGGVYRVRILGDGEEVLAASQLLNGLPEVASVVTRDEGMLELALAGDDAAAAAVLTALIRNGQRVASFAPAASDLEELFLQITDQPTAAGQQPMTEAAA
jgi:hypothetical protein